MHENKMNKNINITITTDSKPDMNNKNSDAALFNDTNINSAKTIDNEPASQIKQNSFARQCIGEALVQLMREKEFESISVTDICKTAGFSRMAYYRNFHSKNDILVKYMNMLADKFRTDLMETYPGISSKSYEIVLFAFKYFKNYHAYAECLIKANLSSILQDGLNYYFDRYVAGTGSDISRRYSLYYYSGALFNIYTTWVKGGMNESPEELAQIVYKRMNKGIQTP